MCRAVRDPDAFWPLMLALGLVALAMFGLIWVLTSLAYSDLVR
jgi:hypothetical protein